MPSPLKRSPHRRGHGRRTADERDPRSASPRARSQTAMQTARGATRPSVWGGKVASSAGDSLSARVRATLLDGRGASVVSWHVGCVRWLSRLEDASACGGRESIEVCCCRCVYNPPVLYSCIHGRYRYFMLAHKGAVYY
eukprot:3473306-Prymnesium_polylepis.1